GGQMGLELSFQEYLERMLSVTAELKRVLKPTGSMWWNHGDCYNSNPAGNKSYDFHGKDGVFGRLRIQNSDGGKRNTPKRKIMYPAKSLLLQAHRLAIRMIDEQGWILRNAIIWHKPNVMPSSVKDRFTVDYEPVFFFTKSKKYWFEQQFEPYTSVIHSTGNALGRSKRSVWKISIKLYKEAHFATFPPALIETPIKAGSPEFICNKCGKARQKIYKGASNQAFNIRVRDVKDGRIKHIDRRATNEETRDYRENYGKGKHFIGYTDCGCNAGWTSGIVLDPFMGSGTTAVVARQLGRNYLGIELNPDYIKLAEKRLKQVVQEKIVCRKVGKVY